MTLLEMDVMRREAEHRARRARNLFGRMECPGPVQVGDLSADNRARPAIAQLLGVSFTFPKVSN